MRSKQWDTNYKKLESGFMDEQIQSEYEYHFVVYATVNPETNLPEWTIDNANGYLLGDLYNPNAESLDGWRFIEEQEPEKEIQEELLADLIERLGGTKEM